MKKMLRLIPMLLLGGGIMLTACGKHDEPPMTGGYKDSTSYSAPKVIKSTEIVDFRCGFSMINVMIPGRDSELLGSAYTLTAEWKDGVVTGRYSTRTNATNSERSQSFQTGREFLEELQKLAAKHDLPQYNGLSREGFGLPGDYGASLSIKYASGESVYASDNQGCFLPLEALEDLERLFRLQVEPEAAPLNP